jgi:hypothetical protein
MGHADNACPHANKEPSMLPDFQIETVNPYGEQALQLDLGGQLIRLDAAEIDHLIEALGLLRRDLTPVVAPAVSVHERYAVETAPKWQVVTHPLFDGVLLFLRHSGYGWAGYGIQAEHVPDLLGDLQRPSDVQICGAMN